MYLNESIKQYFSCSLASRGSFLLYYNYSVRRDSMKIEESFLTNQSLNNNHE